jgi:hypothetical protein
MAFASSVMMFAVSPQNFIALANTEDSFLLLVDVLSVYGRHISSEIAKRPRQCCKTICRGAITLTAVSRPWSLRLLQSRKNLNRCGASAV